jgi:predicted nicotinamide N-methyase
MARVVAPEDLDTLDARDPAAVHARRDLRRIHRAMGTRSILVRGLADLRSARPGRRLHILELGAGDGTLMLGVARTLARTGCAAQLTLLDRQPCVEAATLDGYVRAGWDAAPVATDVARWVVVENARVQPIGAAPARWDLIIASLFLHHFNWRELVALLEAIARRTERFFACEPRRAGLALAASHLVGALGANAVTRNDSVASVRAGFAGTELSALWPAPRGDWELHEYGAGLFSHCLSARRRGRRDADRV